MNWKTLTAAAGIVLAAAATSSAAPIASATSADGAVLLIEFLNDNGDGTYDFKYTADFTAFTGTAEFIIGINFKPGAGTLAGTSDESTTAAGTWQYGINSNLSASDQTCGDDPGNNGFFCGSLGPFDAGPPVNWGLNPTTGTYDWFFTLDLSTAGLDPGSLVFFTPIRALFATFNENSQQWQNSLASLTTGGETGSGGEDGSTVPEPMTLALVGLGLAAAGTKLRRTR